MVGVGAGELLVRKGTFPGIFGGRGLAADYFALDWGVNLRALLGDVELLFVAEIVIR